MRTTKHGIALVLVLIACSSCSPKKNEQRQALETQQLSQQALGTTAVEHNDETRIAEEKARKAEEEGIERAHAEKAEEDQNALLVLQHHLLTEYQSSSDRRGEKRFKVQQGVSLRFIQDVLHNIPQGHNVNLIAMYKAIDGIDGSTTSQALTVCRALFTGKYYVLQGDVFQIQADRDYPREGLNEFYLFGNVNLVGNYYIPVNVFAISGEKIPPYRSAPILAKITGFELGTSIAGKTVVIPTVKVIMAVAPASCCGDPDEVVVSEPSIVTNLLHLQTTESTRNHHSAFAFSTYPNGYLVDQLCSKPTEFEGKLFCYKSGWEAWIKRVEERVAGDRTAEIDYDSGTESPGNLVVSWDPQTRVVFSGCRPHACTDAHAYFIVSSKTREVDIVWQNEAGVMYFGPNASFLRNSDVYKLLDQANQ